MSDIPKWARKRIQEAREKGLTELDLSNDYGAKDEDKLDVIPDEVFELDQLLSLDLGNNKLTSIPESISQLRNLAELNLGGNNLTDFPDGITRLKNLTTLRLNSNNLTTIPESITRLENLTNLNLGHNNLTTIPESITRLENLTTLNLDDNNLTSVPESITRLVKLTTLDISGNELTNFPESIPRLENLTELYLSGNSLTSVPESITRLENLTVFGLMSNKLTSFPESVTNLRNLAHLDLDGNQLTSIPETVARLRSLRLLDMRNNNLTSIPESVTRLEDLNYLNLANNKLTSIPEAITRLENLNVLDLDGNPIERPPKEVVDGGIGAIRNYFRQVRAQGVDHIFEAKLLIVGEGGAGKTTLARKIEDPDSPMPTEDDTTRGIDVHEWHFDMPDGQDFRVNIWDFGGQAIYHATHQFFLTKRSLYALVADERKEDTDFDYWLNVVKLLSESSPLLIVKNKKGERIRQINEKELHAQFGNIKCITDVNLDTTEGLPDLLSEIKHHACKLPLVGTALPGGWVKVRKALEDDQRDYIGLDEYLKLCEQEGFSLEKDKLQLLGYLHDLGVCLHFHEDPVLRKTVILKPEWGTDAVYNALDDKQVNKNFGEFSKDDLKRIWHEKRYEGMHDELLQLMVNFKLCYPLPNKPDTFIAPQLLTKNKPDYEWDETDDLVLRYKYEFMPKGILTRFIVNMHDMIADQSLVWRSGIIIRNEKDDTRAEVIENYRQREINVRVTGKQRQWLMTVVMWELDRINKTFSQLKCDKLMPCNCSVCFKSGNPSMYAADELLQFVADGQNVQCPKSYNMVNPWGLIDSVVDTKELAQRQGESDKQVLRISGKDGDTTINLVLNAIASSSPELQAKLDSRNISRTDVTTEVNVDIEIHNVIEVNLPTLQDAFEELRDETADKNPALDKKLQEVADCLDELSPGSSAEQLNKPMNKLRRLLNQIGDKESDLHKVVEKTENGIALAEKIAGLYDKIAPLLKLAPLAAQFFGA